MYTHKTKKNEFQVQAEIMETPLNSWLGIKTNLYLSAQSRVNIICILYIYIYIVFSLSTYFSTCLKCMNSEIQLGHVWTSFHLKIEPLPIRSYIRSSMNLAK